MPQCCVHGSHAGTMLTRVSVLLQRAKSGLGEVAGFTQEGKTLKAHSMLSSHLQSGGRKNSITGVTKRHLSMPLSSSLSAHLG